MSEHPTDESQPRPKRHLHLVDSDVTSPEHEAQLSLVFFDITDSSMSDEEVQTGVKHLMTKAFTPQLFREHDSSEYPKIIARTMLEEFHIQPELDVLREHAMEDGGPLTDMERQELAHGLEMERLFREATGAIEHAAQMRTTNNLVGALEEHMEAKKYYDTNILRAASSLQNSPEMARYKPSVIVASRIIKTMLLLNEDDASVSPLR